jgi:hypothetical protein
MIMGISKFRGLSEGILRGRVVIDRVRRYRSAYTLLYDILVDKVLLFVLEGEDLVEFGGEQGVVPQEWHALDS